MDYNIKQLSDYSDESLLKEIKRIAKEMDKDTISYKEFKATGGKVVKVTIARHFEFWNDGFNRADLSARRSSGISDEGLFTTIDALWDRLARRPKHSEMKRVIKQDDCRYDRNRNLFKNIINYFSVCSVLSVAKIKLFSVSSVSSVAKIK